MFLRAKQGEARTVDYSVKACKTWLLGALMQPRAELAYLLDAQQRQCSNTVAILGFMQAS